MFTIKNRELDSGKEMALYFDMINRYVGVCPREEESDNGFVLFFDLTVKPNAKLIEHVLGCLKEFVNEIFDAKVVYSGNLTKLHLRANTLPTMNRVYRYLEQEL